MIKRLMMLVCLALGAPALYAQTTLNGAGATFPYPIYSKWFSEYHKQHPEIEINYQSIGSGGKRKIVNPAPTMPPRRRAARPSAG